MSLKHKKYSILLIVLFITGIAWFYLAPVNPIFYLADRAVRKNLKPNTIGIARGIMNGIDESEVIHILGEPSGKVFRNDGYSFYYNVDFDIEPYVEIEFNNKHEVKKVQIHNYVD